MKGSPKTGTTGELRFKVEAHDEFELIGRGFHKLCIIDVDRFAEKVGRKASSPSVPR